MRLMLISIGLLVLRPGGNEMLVAWMGTLFGLLQRDDLAGLSPDKGRFRGFLLASLKHFLSNQRDHARRIKRGGAVTIHSLTIQRLEARVAVAASHSQAADVLFEQEWAMVLLGSVREKLIRERAQNSKNISEDSLLVYLTGDDDAPSYAVMAQQQGTTEAAIKMSVCRMRKRYRTLLRDEIAHTVTTPAEVDDEIRHLISIFQRLCN